MKGNFYDNERVALFIDGSNLYSAARALGFDIDYRRLLKVFREKGRLVRAYYYTALAPPFASTSATPLRYSGPTGSGQAAERHQRDRARTGNSA